MTQLNKLTSQLDISKTLKGSALREYKQKINLNPMQREVLVGTLLGDASMPLQRGNPRLNVLFAQTIVRADYIQHLYSVFYNFVGTPPRVKNIRGGGARDRKCMWFQTYSHPEFKFYDEMGTAPPSIQPMNTKGYAGKNEFLKIFMNYSPQGG